jgi:hypothetical protein
MNSIGNYANQASMAGSYAQTATGPCEPDAAPGSLLAEIQSLEKAAGEVENTLTMHASSLSSILLPEMKPPETMANTPEPMRSEYASRINSVMRTLRQIESRIVVLTQRAKLT